MRAFWVLALVAGDDGFGAPVTFDDTWAFFALAGVWIFLFAFGWLLSGWISSGQADDSAHLGL